MSSKIFFLAPVFLLFTTSAVIAENKSTSYVDGSKPLFLVEDTNRQAEAWAMCAATYDLTADIIEADNPARARQYRELANGAEVAAGMAVFSDGYSENIELEQFNALWAMSQWAMTEPPKTSRTKLLADMESNETPEQVNAFLWNLDATLKVCVQNLEGQKVYVDTWRDLAKRGLFKLPEQ